MSEPSIMISLVSAGAGFIDWTALTEQAFAEVCAEAEAEFDRRWITGSGTGEIRGLAASLPLREPTPMERAFAILDPELRRCPLYDAGPPVIYPSDWKATP